jgi:hypothetical protein
MGVINGQGGRGSGDQFQEVAARNVPIILKAHWMLLGLGDVFYIYSFVLLWWNFI